MSDISTEAGRLVGLALEHELSLPGRIEFHTGSVDRLGALAAGMADPGRALLVTSRGPGDASGRAQRAAALLQGAGFRVTHFSGITAEPTVEITDRGAALAREVDPAVVVAVGGGSVLDCAKAIAALARNPGSVEDYLEGVGRGRQLGRPPVPMIAVPTTSGTGAEMTRNAVIADHGRGFKKSMRDVRMIPSVALLDPSLTVTCPRPVTAAAGMDAVTQLIEPCISVKRQPGPTEIALRALPHAADALSRCCADPGDIAAREAVLMVSAMSGICLANAGLALVHGIASGLGALHPVPHGLICGVLLPHALRFNRDACKEELGAALAAFLNESTVHETTIDRGLAAIAALNAHIGLPPDLKQLGLSDEQVRAVAAASIGSSMSGNPIPMDADSIYTFLRPLA